MLFLPSTSQPCLVILYFHDFADNYSTDVMLEDKVFNVGLWDTGGGEDYWRLRPLSYPQTNVFLLCFSVVNLGSFEHITSAWIPELTHHCPGVPIMLAGLKSDLRNDPETLQHLSESRSRMVEVDEAEGLVFQGLVDSYMECSSLNDTGVQELFEEVIRLGAFGKKAKHQKNKQPRKSECLIM